jgi:hypothetical protein
VDRDEARRYVEEWAAAWRRRDRAAEVFQLGPTGRVVRGEVFYGMVPE